MKESQKQSDDIGKSGVKSGKLSKSQEKFLDEFMEWDKDRRDKYTKEVLKWLGDVLLAVAKEPNLLRKKKIVEMAFRNKAIVERIPIIFIYAVKPEFRHEMARILRALNSLASVFS